MQETTHREYRTWLVWLDEQWNRPSRSDNYLMQVATEIRRVLNLLCVFGSKKRAETVSQDQMKIKFVQPGPQKATRQSSAISKSRWLTATGLKRKKDGR